VHTGSLPPSAQSIGDVSAVQATPHLHSVKLSALIVFFIVCTWFAVEVVRGGLTLDTPIIGAAFVRPFREHHTDPLGIVRHGFVETNGNNVIVSLPILVPAALLLPVTSSRFGWIVGSFTLCFIFAVFLTNQFHKWAHQAAPPAVAVRLQRAGLILSKDHHDVHHTSPFDTHYCITVGLWNPLLERAQFWSRLERAIRRWVPGTDPRLRVVREGEARARVVATAGGRVDG
jgi:hypothetical protein